MAQKVSIRFYNDHEVRAVWNEGSGQWYFSVLDVIGAINQQDDYAKTRNYWKYLKNKLKNEGNKLVSDTNQLKLRRIPICSICIFPLDVVSLCSTSYARLAQHPFISTIVKLLFADR